MASWGTLCTSGFHFFIAIALREAGYEFQVRLYLCNLCLKLCQIFFLSLLCKASPKWLQDIFHSVSEKFCKALLHDFKHCWKKKNHSFDFMFWGLGFKCLANHNDWTLSLNNILKYTTCFGWGHYLLKWTKTQISESFDNV